MKRIKSLNYIFVIILSLLVLAGCKKDKTSTTVNKVVPTSMTVDVPSSLNSQNTSKRMMSDSLKGNDIYQSLRGFVWIGVAGAQVMNELCTLVQVYDLTKITTATFTGNDGLSKTLTMKQNVAFDGTTWSWEMQLTDFDGSDALEFFWNLNPVQGEAIYQPYKIDHSAIFSSLNKTAIAKIQYSEAEANYTKQMIVSIDSLTMLHTNDPNNIKLFVGKRKSDGNLDVWGNSNHPNAIIFDPNHTGGYQWAFVAHCQPDLDFSIAEVSLPPCNYTNNDTTSLWGKYSLYNVLDGELVADGASQTTINAFIAKAEAPGYFQKGIGFIACGKPAPTSPAGFTPTFCDLTALTPYVPNDIKTLKIVFAKK